MSPVKAGFEEVTKDMSVGALAYVSVPLADVGKLDPFSPEFQSLVTDKGGIILNMLRWVIGDQAFDKTMRTFLSQYAGKSASVDDFRKVAEQASGQQLTWFFTQWLNSTGAPEFKNKYTVYRTQKGFRVVGEIQQDMDLFRMPVELKIDTDGKTETQRIEVSGTNSAYAVETFGRPRKISIDPGNMVLQNSKELQVRTSIMRGQQDVEQGDLVEALKEFQKALDVNKNSSLAHYRIAEVFFLQHNYQSAANAYRESLNGDGVPRWTEVWSHIQLGKIFDLTGQRERATNEYRQALQTNDNTQNALDEARKYLQKPFSPRRAGPTGCSSRRVAIQSQDFSRSRGDLHSRCRSPREFQPAQTRGFFSFHAVRHHQHLKCLAHSAGRDQVFELQRHLGALLRQRALLKRIGELRLLSNADQKLRLRDQRQAPRVRARRRARAAP